MLMPLVWQPDSETPSSDLYYTRNWKACLLSTCGALVNQPLFVPACVPGILPLLLVIPMCGLRVGRIPPEFPGGYFSLCPDVSLGTAPCLSLLPCLSGPRLCWPSRCLGNPSGRRWDTCLGQQAVGAGRGQSQELLPRDRCREDTSPVRPRGGGAIGLRAPSAEVIRHLRAAAAF